MITGSDIYHVFSAVVPLYVAMFLGFVSVKWLKIFTPDQCAGINRFVALFAVPLLSFDFISSNNPYDMNLRFIAADTLQKVVALIVLFIWATFTPGGSLEWSITLFSVTTLPNTLVMGIPLLKSMYGDFSGSLMIQIVALQSLVWTTVLLILFEFRAARILIKDQFPETAGSIGSFKVDSDVHSLDGREPLEAETELGEDGKLHVKLRRSPSCCSSVSLPRMSNVEIYSLPSLRREESYKGSSFGNIELSSVVNGKGVHEGDDEGNDLHLFDRSLSTSCLPVFRVGAAAAAVVPNSDHDHDHQGDDVKDELGSGNGPRINKANSHGPRSLNLGSSLTRSKTRTQTGLDTGRDREDPLLPKLGSRSTSKVQPNPTAEGESRVGSKPPAMVMTRLIVTMAWRKLIRNPNTYAGVIGLIWSLIAFKLNIKLPKIVSDSISILSRTGLGMAMFGLGLFMALQPKIIACGKTVAVSTMAVRFIVGPLIMAATSAALGLKSVFLRLAIVQATLPQAILPFVLANEYKLHAKILSTGVIFGMLISLPITLVYYAVLEVIK